MSNSAGSCRVDEGSAGEAAPVVHQPAVRRVDVAVELAVGQVRRGRSCSQLLDLPYALRGLLAQASDSRPDELVHHEGQRADHRGQAADQHHGGASDRGIRTRAAANPPPERAARTAAARYVSGMITMLSVPTIINSAQVPRERITIIRHDQAGAIRRSRGTSASSRLATEGWVAETGAYFGRRLTGVTVRPARPA